MTLRMAFTGQVMRFDQDAYWGLGIGSVHYGACSDSWRASGQVDVRRSHHRQRHVVAVLCTFRVFIVPAMLLAFVGVHLLMVLKLGINEWPVPGRVVRRETYLKEYTELTHKDGVPFIPDAFRKDLIFRHRYSRHRRMRSHFRSVWPERGSRPDRCAD